jgi:hypothetical protein
MTTITQGAGTNAVLCKTCSVLMCVLEQPIVDNSSVGPLRGAGTYAVLCKTCSLLLCALEQPIVDNSSVGPLSAGPNWEQLVQLA